MAQATNFYPSQNVSVWYQKETTSGALPDDAGLKKLQTTSFTIPEASVPVEYSAQRSGQFVTTANQGHHSEGTKLWTFDTTLRGTTTSVLLALESLFEDSTTSPRVLQNTYEFPHASYTNGSTSSPNTFDIRFVNAGADSATETVECAGCIATGFTLAQDIASEGGELVCTINWATAYMPTHSGDDISSAEYDTGTPKNIRNLKDTKTFINGGSNEELVVSSWELNVSRTIERVHYKDTTSGTFAPFGYAMVGSFEITGSITAIRNDDVHDLLAKFYDGNTVSIQLSENTETDFKIVLGKCFLNEPSVDSGGAVLTQIIPFTVVADDNIGSASDVVSINCAN